MGWSRLGRRRGLDLGLVLVWDVSISGVCVRVRLDLVEEGGSGGAYYLSILLTLYY